jgi:hypothetical protein
MNVWNTIQNGSTLRCVRSAFVMIVIILYLQCCLSWSGYFTTKYCTQKNAHVLCDQQKQKHHNTTHEINSRYCNRKKILLLTVVLSSSIFCVVRRTRISVCLRIGNRRVLAVFDCQDHENERTELHRLSVRHTFEANSDHSLRWRECLLVVIFTVNLGI